MIDVNELLKAVFEDNVDALKTLIDDNPIAELRHIKVNNLTIAHLAILNNRPLVLDHLLETCFSPETEDKDGDTLLIHAVGAENPTANDCVDVLLNHCANVNHHNRTATTPIMVAAYMCNLYSINRLIEHGAEVNEHNTLGESPISYAVNNFYRRNGRATMPQQDIIVTLLKAGASIVDLYQSHCALAVIEPDGSPALIPLRQYSPSMLYWENLCLVLVNPNNTHLLNQLL